MKTHVHEMLLSLLLPSGSEELKMPGCSPLGPLLPQPDESTLFFFTCLRKGMALFSKEMVLTVFRKIFAYNLYVHRNEHLLNKAPPSLTENPFQ